MYQAVVLLGSNYEAVHHIHAALEALHESNALTVEASSQILVGPAVDELSELHPTAPYYHNMAVLVSTRLMPMQLRSELRAIEERLGRDRRSRQTEQVPIDLDLVVFDDMVLEESGLSIPDTAIERHVFAAIPVAQVIPDWIHPLSGKSYAEIASALDSNLIYTRRSQ